MSSVCNNGDGEACGFCARESRDEVNDLRHEVVRLRRAIELNVKRLKNCGSDESCPTIDMVEIDLTETLLHQAPRCPRCHRTEPSGFGCSSCDPDTLGLRLTEATVENDRLRRALEDLRTWPCEGQGMHDCKVTLGDVADADANDAAPPGHGIWFCGACWDVMMTTYRRLSDEVKFNKEMK